MLSCFMIMSPFVIPLREDCGVRGGGGGGNGGDYDDDRDFIVWSTVTATMRDDSHRFNPAKP